MRSVHRSWHLLIDAALPGHANMARDQALLDLAERDGLAALRLYRWNPFCLSFGRNEPALRRYDRSRVESIGLDCVRRPTGGRAVWHARELTYAVVAPLECFGSLPQAYHAIHLMLSDALRALGADPALASVPARASGLDAGACFASPAGGEIMAGGAKVVGSAQLRQGNAFLQHGSILLDDDQEMVQRVTRGTPPPGLDAPLTRILHRSVLFDEVAATIREAAHAWPATWSAWEDDAELTRLASRQEEHFRSAEWTWRR